jgi:hypothetical protein
MYEASVWLYGPCIVLWTMYEVCKNSVLIMVAASFVCLLYLVSGQIF